MASYSRPKAVLAGCVATDVGDTAIIIGEVGELIPVNDTDEAAAAILRIRSRIESDGDGLRIAVRKRISENFSIANLVAASTNEFLEVTRG